MKSLWSTLRYGSSGFDLRDLLFKLCAYLQRKPLLILRENPQACTRVLAASDRKGAFLERLLAAPAWLPIYSIESEDGERWEELAVTCQQILAHCNWQANIPSLVKREVSETAALLSKSAKIFDGEQVARLSLRVLSDCLFEQPLSPDDEGLFYRASLEWRREIAIKSRGDTVIKKQFVARLASLIQKSKFAAAFAAEEGTRSLVLSAIAQPFILSPQINVSDIFAATYSFLLNDPLLYQQVQQEARKGNHAYLEGVLFEAIRLKHPFPILERELTKTMVIEGKDYPPGTQVFILLDQLKQEREFKPERWLNPESAALYAGLIFGAGRRLCLGKGLARLLLRELLREVLVQLPLDQVQPQQGHLYSGRDNDKPSFGESCYQIRKFAGAIAASYVLGSKKNRGCPLQR